MLTLLPQTLSCCKLQLWDKSSNVFWSDAHIVHIVVQVCSHPPSSSDREKKTGTNIFSLLPPMFLSISMINAYCMSVSLTLLQCSSRSPILMLFFLHPKPESECLSLSYFLRFPSLPSIIPFLHLSFLNCLFFWLSDWHLSQQSAGDDAGTRTDPVSHFREPSHYSFGPLTKVSWPLTFQTRWELKLFFLGEFTLEWKLKCTMSVNEFT